MGSPPPPLAGSACANTVDRLSGLLAHVETTLLEVCRHSDIPDKHNMAETFEANAGIPTLIPAFSYLIYASPPMDLKRKLGVVQCGPSPMSEADAAAPLDSDSDARQQQDKRLWELAGQLRKSLEGLRQASGVDLRRSSVLLGSGDEVAPLPLQTGRAPSESSLSSTARDGTVDGDLSRRVAELLLDVHQQRSKYGAEVSSMGHLIRDLSMRLEAILDDDELWKSCGDWLSFQPTYTPANPEEVQLWKRWLSPRHHLHGDRSTGILTLCDAYELTMVNRRRFDALMKRWNLAQKRYFTTVDRINQRLSKSFLELENAEEQLQALESSGTTT